MRGGPSGLENRNLVLRNYHVLVNQSSGTSNWVLFHTSSRNLRQHSKRWQLPRWSSFIIYELAYRYQFIELIVDQQDGDTDFHQSEHHDQSRTRHCWWRRSWVDIGSLMTFENRQTFSCSCPTCPDVVSTPLAATLIFAYSIGWLEPTNSRFCL